MPFTIGNGPNVYTGVGRGVDNWTLPAELNNGDLSVISTITSYDPTKRAFRFQLKVRNAGTTVQSCVVHFCTWDPTTNMLYEGVHKTAAGGSLPSMVGPTNVAGGGAPVTFQADMDIPLAATYVAAVIYIGAVFHDSVLHAAHNKYIAIKLI